MVLSEPFQRENPDAFDLGRGARRNASTACFACKARRSRCKNGRPCENCIAHNTPCVFDDDSDRRRRLPLKRQIQSLEGSHELLNRLIQSVQESDTDQLEQLLRRFRSIASSDNDDTNTDQPGGTQGSTQSPTLSLQRMRIGDAISPRNCVHSIHRWTTIVDDATASRLLSLYFNLDGLIWTLVDQELFLQDLNDGRSRFCSPLLLHVLLFYACGFFYKDRCSENELRDRLLEQITPLWHREKLESSLTTAQSGLILGALICAFGQDKLGTKFIDLGIGMALHIGVHTGDPACFAIDGFHDADQVRRAHRTIAWAMYDYYIEYAHANRHAPFWSVPPMVTLSQQDAAEADRNQKWAPCHQPVRYYATSYARSQLVPIIAEITTFSAASVTRALTVEAWKTGQVFLDRLADWKRNLSERLHVQRSSSPSTLCLHMSYYTSITLLCEVFSSKASPETEPATQGSHSFQPQALIQSSMGSIASLILLYGRTHGWKAFPVAMINHITMAGVYSVSRLLDKDSIEASPEGDKWTKVVTACVSGLWNMSPVWPLCQFLLRMVQLIVKSSPAVVLPPEVLTIFANIGSEIWAAELAKSPPSEYIVHLLPQHLRSREGGSSSDTLENVLMALDDGAGVPAIGQVA